MPHLHARHNIYCTLHIIMVVAKQWFPWANPAGNKSMTKALACTMLQPVRAFALCLCVALHSLMECCSAESYCQHVV